jgi:hypothetical protein
MLDVDDDAPLFVPSINIGMSLDNPFQRIAPVDDRFELSGLRQLLQKIHILGALGCRPGEDSLAARHCGPRYLSHLREPGDNHEKTSMLVKRGLALRKRGRAGCNENDVVGLAVLGEIPFGVVDDLVGPDGFHQLQIGGAAHPGHLGSKVLGELDRGGPDCSRSSG